MLDDADRVTEETDDDARACEAMDVALHKARGLPLSGGGCGCGVPLEHTCIPHRGIAAALLNEQSWGLRRALDGELSTRARAYWTAEEAILHVAAEELLSQLPQKG